MAVQGEESEGSYAASNGHSWNGCSLFVHIASPLTGTSSVSSVSATGLRSINPPVRFTAQASSAPWSPVTFPVSYGWDPAPLDCPEALQPEPLVLRHFPSPSPLPPLLRPDMQPARSALGPRCQVRSAGRRRRVRPARDVSGCGCG